MWLVAAVLSVAYLPLPYCQSRVRNRLQYDTRHRHSVLLYELNTSWSSPPPSRRIQSVHGSLDREHAADLPGGTARRSISSTWDACRCAFTRKVATLSLPICEVDSLHLLSDPVTWTAKLLRGSEKRESETCPRHTLRAAERHI